MSNDVQSFKEPAYPKGMDETKLRDFMKEILDGIDRDKLIADKRLVRVRHPLLAERMGQDVALNVELVNLINGFTDGLTIRGNIDNKQDIQKRGSMAAEILKDSSKEPQIFAEQLRNLEALTQQLSELNDTEDDDSGSSALIAIALRSQLKMPTLAQDLVLYSAVTRETLEVPRGEILKAIEEIRKSALAQLEKPDLNEDGKQFRKEELAEAEFVKGWYEKNVA